LLKNSGLNISEPMVFGIGSGLLFVYLPFIKVNHAPAISYRTLPGQIFNKVARRLNLKIKRQKFSSVSNATKALDENLKNNIPTGLQVGVYNLSYFPDEYRFHFNAHNLVVYGKTETDYLISDPVMETVTTLTHAELDKVRFAKGAFAPKGQMYYPIQVQGEVDFKSAIIKGIKDTCRTMLAPMPIVGVRGIRFVSRRIRKWPVKHGVRKANHYLAQMVRMQEEIGTGGAGFRFIYAGFLQEAAQLLDKPQLTQMSERLIAIGDGWRAFALKAARMVKGREPVDPAALAGKLREQAQQEETFFRDLKAAVA
jgi:hypothetical protein